MADLSKFVEYAKSFFLQRAAGYCLIVLSSLFVVAPLGVLQVRLGVLLLLLLARGPVVVVVVVVVLFLF